jgi:hypothetical protein
MPETCSRVLKAMRDVPACTVMTGFKTLGHFLYSTSRFIILEQYGNILINQTISSTIIQKSKSFSLSGIGDKLLLDDLVLEPYNL